MVAMWGAPGKRREAQGRVGAGGEITRGPPPATLTECGAEAGQEGTSLMRAPGSSGKQAFCQPAA